MAKTFDLILKNGVVVNCDGEGKRDIGVIDGVIVDIGDLSQASAGETIDCAGLHVLPGVIDTQVHFREPGPTHKEDLESGSRAAVLGGVTAVFEMPNTNPLTTTAAALEDKLNRAHHRMFCDHAFYVGATHQNPKDLIELERMKGVCGVKIFMGASTGDLLVEDDEGVLNVLRHGSRRVAVHSEDEYMLRENKKFAREGDWTSHTDVRTAEAAVSSTIRLLRLAREARRRIHVLHISTADEAPLLAAAKDVATAEVTPQHLTLAAPDCYRELKGLAQMNPPIRDAAHRDGLWAALRRGVFDVIGSDHAPHTLEEKAKPYPASPSGMPGVQTLVPIMLDHVAAGRLSLERFVALAAENPARPYGMRRKGRIEIGCDADLTIVDLEAEREIRNDWIRSRCAWTPFDGMKVRGWPRATVVRGRIVMREDEIVAPGSGRPIDFDLVAPRA